MRAKRRTWVSYTAISVKMTIGQILLEDKSGRYVYKKTLERLREKDTCETTRWRRQCSFRTFQGDLKSVHLCSSSAYGRIQVAKHRFRALRFAPWLAKAGYLPEWCLSQCPVCLCQSPESLQHFLLRCDGYEAIRAQLIGGELAEMGALEDDTKCVLLLGGRDDSLDHEDANLIRRSQTRTMKGKLIKFIGLACTRRALLSGLKGGGNALECRPGVLPEGVT